MRDFIRQRIFIEEQIKDALVRNYIKPLAIYHIEKAFEKILEEHKGIKKNLIGVKLIRSNGENYGICIKYASSWINEYSEDLIQWSEDKYHKKVSCLATFHFIIMEYKSSPSLLKR